MTKERVTRDDLRNMRVGQQLIFVLPDAKLCESARVQAAQLAAYEGMEFKCTKDIPNKTIAITRLK